MLILMSMRGPCWGAWSGRQTAEERHGFAGSCRGFRLIWVQFGLDGRPVTCLLNLSGLALHIRWKVFLFAASLDVAHLDFFRHYVVGQVNLLGLAAFNDSNASS